MTTQTQSHEPQTAPESKRLLEVRHLKKHFPVKAGVLQRTVGYIKAVDDVSFHIDQGETLGLVGESGCGKSTTGRTIIRLYEPTSGQIIFGGQDISHLSERQLRSIRQDIQMVYQDPFSSLNPRKTIGTILEEPFSVHRLYSKKERQERVEALLEKVGLNPSWRNRYPHEFSGGQRQRIGIARALTLQPKLIIADEPVSALDVSIQAQVLNLFEDLQDEFKLTYLFISHDLGVVKHICDRVGVMYLGKLMEIADKNSLYDEPLHPYTQALLSAVPRPNPNIKKRERIILKGDVPSPVNPPAGCVFHTRCPMATDHCKTNVPEMHEVKPGHFVACHLYHE
ncbi:peptide/nickel transport system ATP-binding protein/oligopeptide transport system ATP-binding protein [Caldalkalibacillus uzonensis]|uniref:Peptide/nickel transport system ATP-binding protein/oligopeptide transport system ATP-binding protein n=1 Tax=Caldalkalibacillus uzonensis TaxID=353224 RepID=A0ABU0CW09_9BACI|nr:dipeptide ABC transporter ATP-binding protein [Caldalkalibacillus uzonensis]MDQ0340603.1 peptide/nickel transport system ATP-binding protein/oligopeptide transport system ATP-binding protein [Caldalkalibacillus uzonensis]